MSFKKYILTVTLNPSLDKIVLKENQKEVLCAGGKGINVSRALTKLGVPTLTTGLLGKVNAGLFKGFLNKEGISHDFVLIDGKVRINTTWLDSSRGEIKRHIEKGPKVKASDLEIFSSKVSYLLAAANFLVLSGRNAYAAPSDFYKKLVLRAHHVGVLSLCDTSGLSFKTALKARPWMIKPNLKEAEGFFNKKLDSFHKIKKALEEFHRLGIPRVVISLGKEGALASDREDKLFIQAPKVKMLQDVGCGDAFLAGFLFGLKNKNAFHECCQWAVASGSCNASNLIPGDIDPKVCLKLKSELKIIKI